MPIARKMTFSGPTLSLIVATVMVMLYGIDKFLADQEQTEMQREAQNHYTEGRRLLHAGQAHQSVPEFARARSIERSNREYQLALATAQLTDRQFATATDTLNDVLDEDSNDGRANLLMARVLAAEGKLKDADAYYHRAIYGEWPPNSTEPYEARLELANLLAGHGNDQELLSELLLLESNPTTDPATEKQIADLFLQAGSASRAADVYRRILHADSRDVEANLGLAKAAVMEGEYRAAENAVMVAIRARPYDESIQARLRQVVRLASLDPTSRHLGAAEKYRRSLEILRLVQDELSACGQSSPPADSEQLTGPATNEAAEGRLDEAETLWKQRQQSCKTPPRPDDPLVILMKKLSL